MSRLKLLLTNKNYRKLIRMRIKYALLSLPVISYIINLPAAYKMYKEYTKMGRWEQYVAQKNEENKLKENEFVIALWTLKIYIRADYEDRELFEDVKSEVLSSDEINKEKHKDFKKWLEGIDFTETDFSRVQELINTFT